MEEEEEEEEAGAPDPGEGLRLLGAAGTRCTKHPRPAASSHPRPPRTGLSPAARGWGWGGGGGLDPFSGIGPAGTLLPAGKRGSSGSGGDERVRGVPRILAPGNEPGASARYLGRENTRFPSWYLYFSF